jgi:hypothetical protein
MQQAHDYLSELELKPNPSEAPKSLALKAKKRAPQVLFRTESPCDQLVPSEEQKVLPSTLDQPQSTGGCMAAVDFSDVSLDWGLGKLVRSVLLRCAIEVGWRLYCCLQDRCTNLPDFSSRVLQVIWVGTHPRVMIF